MGKKEIEVNFSDEFDGGYSQIVIPEPGESLSDAVLRTLDSPAWVDDDGTFSESCWLDWSADDDEGMVVVHPDEPPCSGEEHQWLIQTANGLQETTFVCDLCECVHSEGTQARGASRQSEDHRVTYQTKLRIQFADPHVCRCDCDCDLLSAQSQA